LAGVSRGPIVANDALRDVEVAPGVARSVFGAQAHRERALEDNDRWCSQQMPLNSITFLQAGR
jgi:hypothetical protein